jgi:hypothetical protein
MASAQFNLPTLYKAGFPSLTNVCKHDNKREKIGLNDKNDAFFEDMCSKRQK